MTTRPATRPDPGQEARIPLTRERVLETAILMADAGGLDSLSMRKLAQALGVEAMSLYHHVANKDDILDGMVDRIVGEFELPAVDGDWKTALRRSAISAHDVLEQHPWACALMMSPTRVRPARLRYMEGLLRRLRLAGLSAAMTDHAYHALDSHILGYTLWEAGYAVEAAKVADFTPRFLQMLSADEFPFLVEHVQQHLDPSLGDDIRDFEFGLDLILDGLDRVITGG